MRLRELFASPFFPDQGFGWVFAFALVVVSVLAAVYDTRKAIIPKWITLGTLGVGLILNTVRGGWLGSQGSKVWMLAEGAGVGAADGFLFALVGALFGFGLFFVVWILGVCGGGDVKLMTALGAWFGPYGVVLFLIFSTVALAFWVVGMMVFGGRSVKSMRQKPKAAPPPHKGGKARQTRVTFSVPAAVASLVILFWVFGEDLGVRPAKGTPQPQGDAHVDRSSTTAL